MTSHERRFIAGRFTACVATALLLVSSAACDKPPAERTHQHIADGDRLAGAGKYAAAAIEYRNAIRLTPSSVEAQEKLADVASRAGQPALALQTLLRVADLKPDDRSAQLRAASIYLLSGRYEESRARAEAAIQVDETDATAHFVLGEALAGLHEPARSEASLREAIRLAPALPQPHVALASKDWSAGNVAGAEAELRRAVELGPADMSANRALAIFLMATGRGRQAEPAWAVVAAGPRGLPFALADYFVVMNRLAEAERALVALIARGVNRDAARVRLAAVQSARNRPADAHRTVNEVLGDSPHSVPALLLEARLLQSDGRLDDAIRVAHRAVEANPHQLEPLLVQGDIFAARGDAADADRSFELAFHRLGELEPSGSGGTLLGLLLEQQHHPADAERAFERALAANPSDGIAANNLAWLYQQEGRLDEALRWATVANDQLRRGETRDTLGWIRVQRGEYREALTILQGAIQAKPENPLYHYHLAVAYAKTGSSVRARDEVNLALASGVTFSGREEATRLRARLDGAPAATPQ
jgi:tetratricopeptide (TPR) repeat protein